MLYLAAYDISKARARKRIADRLLAIGMERIQKSVYLGKVRSKSLNKVLRQAARLMGPEDRLYVVPLSQDQLRRIRTQGPVPDLDLAAGTLRAYVV
jgi:CRISPR-associated protein Cas2